MNATELFHELLLGSEGGWFGLLGIMIILFLLRYLTRWTNLFSTVILFLLGLIYYENVPTSSSLFWGFPLCWLFAIFFMIDFGWSLKKGDL